MRAVILALALLASPSLSSTTLSCFSFGLLDLPTFGFSGEEVVTEKSKVRESCLPHVISSCVYKHHHILHLASGDGAGGGALLPLLLSLLPLLPSLLPLLPSLVHKLL